MAIIIKGRSMVMELFHDGQTVESTLSFIIDTVGTGRMGNNMEKVEL